MTPDRSHARSHARRGRSLTWPLVLALVLAGCALPAPTTPGNLAGPPGAAAPQPAPQVLAAGVVKGRVMAFDRATGRFSPLVGAAVSVEGTALSATTDAEGGYALEGLEPGEYRIRATKDGFTGTPAEVKVNAVMGLERVDLAVARPRSGYGLKQLATTEFEVFGVIRDIRGCAVPNSTMYVTSSVGSIADIAGGDLTVVVTPPDPTEPGKAAKVTTETGYYAFAAVDASDYVRFTASVYGQTRGGIPLERTGAAFSIDLNDTAVPVQDADGQALTLQEGQFDVQLNKFTGTVAPSGFPPYVLGEDTAELQVSRGLSARPDEFFVRLVQGRDQYDVVPIEVKDGNTVIFRVPATLNATQSFTASIVQLGLQASAPSAPLSVGTFDEATFRSLVQVVRRGVLLQPELRQLSDSFQTTNRYFTAAERVQLRVPVRNPRTYDLRVQLSFKIEGADAGDLTARIGGQVATVERDVDDPDLIVVPFTIRARTGSTELVVEFTPQGTELDGSLSNNATFFAKDLALSEPRRGLVLNGANDFQPTNRLTVRAFDPAGWTIARAVADDNAPSNGRGLVRLTLAPPTNYVGPQGAFRIYDILDNSLTIAPTAPEFRGTTGALTTDLTAGSVVLPSTDEADRTAVFIVGQPGGLDAERAVVFGSGAQSLDSLQASVDAALGKGFIALDQDTTSDNLIVTLVNGGNRIGLKSAGTALALLGLTEPVAPVARTGGFTPSLVGATTNRDGWTVRPISERLELDSATITALSSDVTLLPGALHGTQDSDGKTVVALEVVPSPTALPLTNTAPLEVIYRVVGDPGLGSVTVGGLDASRAEVSHHAYSASTLTFRGLDLGTIGLSGTVVDFPAAGSL
ncbi:MAG: carboxypeptidase regulatory-like domain-containing protein [Candidatus Sericytochromatia bacterium]|nr:carboxypeptidase regulatory-like domain-containing protein [Candidatus Sericytochromatia bacterium]